MFSIYLIFIFLAMISAMHELTRHKDLVVKKRAKDQDNKLLDPNSFPIQRLSADLIEEYESIWDVEKDTLKKQMLRKVGHYLNLKDSTIDHHGKLTFF